MSRFNRVSLIEFCDNKSIVLDSIPDKCNRHTRVSGQCLTGNCDGRFEKDIRQLFDISGAYCKGCVYRRTRLKNDGEYGRLKLLEFCKDSGVTLDKIPEHTNRETRVSGQCLTGNCDGRFEKDIRQLFDISGAYCKGCVYRRTLYNDNGEYGLLKLLEFCKDSGVTLDKIPEHTNREIRVSGQCLTGNCDGRFEKGIRQLFDKSGAYCKRCTTENKTSKRLSTNVELHGEDHVRLRLEKAKQTNIERYSVENPFQNEDVKQKSKETCIKKYGAPFANQNAEVLERNQKAQYRRKLYITPSGEEWSLQGYEPLVAPRLIEQYQEENITSDIKIVPAVPWTDSNGKTHVYRCDFYVESLKLIIEVKSTWTAQKDEEKIKKCMDYWSNQGNTYRLIISDNKGNYLYDRTNHDILSIPFDWHKSP
jgi:hypothetical protein